MLHSTAAIFSIARSADGFAPGALPARLVRPHWRKGNGNHRVHPCTSMTLELEWRARVGRVAQPVAACGMTRSMTIAWPCGRCGKGLSRQSLYGRHVPVNNAGYAHRQPRPTPCTQVSYADVTGDGKADVLCDDVAGGHWLRVRTHLVLLLCSPD